MLVCVSDWLKNCLWNVGLFSQATGQVPVMRSCSATLVKRIARQEYLHGVRAIFVWPWNENARKNGSKRTETERFDWFIERIQTRVAFWLVKRTVRWKNFKLENFLEIYRYFALTSYCNTTGQSNKCFPHTRVFFGGKTKIPSFDLFVHWLIEQIMNTYQNHFSRSYENRSIISIYQANFSPWRELSADVSIAVKLKRCYIFFQFNSL